MTTAPELEARIAVLERKVGVPVLALNSADAARALGVSVKTILRQRALGRLRSTEYGTYPITELQRHLTEQTKI